MKEKIVRNLKTNFTAREENGERWIIGLIPYNSRSENLNFWDENDPCFEVIEESAFKKTLADKAEVRALFAHDANKVLGSTKSETLQLEQSSEGLICRCKVPNTTWGNDAFEVISRGDVTTMSFGFIPYKQERRGNVTYLQSVKLEEVSFCVAYPAYEKTTSFTSIRSLLKTMELERLNQIIGGDETVTEEEKKELKSVIEKLQTIIKEDEKEENLDNQQPDKREQPDGTPKENGTEQEELEKLALLCEMELEN